MNSLEPLPPRFFNNRVFVIGGRIDGTGSFGGSLGVDMNLEWQWAPFANKKGWFLNVNTETNFSHLPMFNWSVGGILGLVVWPKNFGDAAVTVAGGSTLTQAGAGIEVDVTVALDGSSIVFFLGFGGGTPTSNPGYGSFGESYYLGSDIFNIPQEIWDALPPEAKEFIQAYKEDQEFMIKFYGDYLSNPFIGRFGRW